MEDLVRPRPPNAGDHSLVAQHGMQPSRFGCADLRQSFRTDAECLRSEMCKLFFKLLGVEQPDAGALLRAGLGEHEPRASLEDELERRRLRARLAGLEVLQATGSHQVHEQHELPVGRGEEEPLRATLRARKLPAL
jgi:hypothetical protein